MLREETIIKTVKEYIKRLPVKVDEAIIFGSSAKGTRLWDSDIDLIVISEDFKGLNQHERMVLLLKYWFHKRIVLEGFGFTKKEYLNKVKTNLWFKKDIVKYGIKLKFNE